MKVKGTEHIERVVEVELDAREVGDLIDHTAEEVPRRAGASRGRAYPDGSASRPRPSSTTSSWSVPRSDTPPQCGRPFYLLGVEKSQCSMRPLYGLA